MWLLCVDWAPPNMVAAIWKMVSQSKSYKKKCNLPVLLRHPQSQMPFLLHSIGQSILSPAPGKVHLLIWEAACTYREGEACPSTSMEASYHRNLLSTSLWFLFWLSVFSLWLLLRFYIFVWCSAILQLNLKIQICVHLSMAWDAIYIFIWKIQVFHRF